eukprot:6367442-Prorocentrum_lima.AAC.1
MKECLLSVPPFGCCHCWTKRYAIVGIDSLKLQFVPFAAPTVAVLFLPLPAGVAKQSRQHSAQSHSFPP